MANSANDSTHDFIIPSLKRSPSLYEVLSLQSMACPSSCHDDFHDQPHPAQQTIMAFICRRKGL
jgi:hypothetical protein